MRYQRPPRFDILLLCYYCASKLLHSWGIRGIPDSTSCSCATMGFRTASLMGYPRKPRFNILSLCYYGAFKLLHSCGIRGHPDPTLYCCVLLLCYHAALQTVLFIGYPRTPRFNIILLCYYGASKLLHSRGLEDLQIQHSTVVLLWRLQVSGLPDSTPFCCAPMGLPNCFTHRVSADPQIQHSIGMLLWGLQTGSLMRYPRTPRFNTLLLCYYGASKLPHFMGYPRTPRFNTLLTCYFGAIKLFHSCGIRGPWIRHSTGVLLWGFKAASLMGGSVWESRGETHPEPPRGTPPGIPRGIPGGVPGGDPQGIPGGSPGGSPGRLVLPQGIPLWGGLGMPLFFVF